MPHPDRPLASAALFDTAIGTCAIAWSPAGVLRFALPDGDPESTRAYILRKHRTFDIQEAAPTAEIATAIEKIRAHLAGDLDDLDWIPLDTSPLNDFDRAVYAVARAIHPGHTLSYGDIANRIGAPAAPKP